MKFAFVLLTIFVLFFGNLNFKWGTHAILGGAFVEEIKFGHFMVAIKAKRDVLDFFCGGVVLSPTKFVTAAHCLYNMTSALVSLGSLDPYADMVFFDLKEKDYVLHPAWYHTEARDHDIAVGFMPGGIVFDDDINRVAVVERGYVHENLMVAAYGYGASDGNPDVTFLRWTITNVMNFQDCANRFIDRELDESIHFCLGPTQTHITHTSFGDSGGPILECETSKLVGIISGGRPGEPDICLKVAEYREFLKNPRGDITGGSGSS